LDGVFGSQECEDPLADGGAAALAEAGLVAAAGAPWEDKHIVI
jgi:hypothetical protein